MKTIPITFKRLQETDMKSMFDSIQRLLSKAPRRKGY